MNLEKLNMFLYHGTPLLQRRYQNIYNISQGNGISNSKWLKSIGQVWGTKNTLDSVWSSFSFSFPALFCEAGEENKGVFCDYWYTNMIDI